MSDNIFEAFGSTEGDEDPQVIESANAFDAIQFSGGGEEEADSSEVVLPADEDPFAVAGGDSPTAHADFDSEENIFPNTSPILSDGDDSAHSPTHGHEAADNFFEEPEAETPLSLWQENRKIELNERRMKEQAEKTRLREQASMDIETFINRRIQSNEERQVINRAEEEEFLADLESVMEYGTLWEKVAKLVDLKPKKGREEEHTSRMRNLLIQLKSEKTTEVAKI